MKGKFYELRDVIEMMGLPYTRKSRLRVVRMTRRRLAEAAGRLDCYDPQHHGRCYRFTGPALRHIFPEFFDKKDDVEKELARQFRDIQRRIDALAEALEAEAKRRRAADEVLADAIRQARAEARGRPAA